MMRPTQFKPGSPAEFIGKAKRIGHLVFRRAEATTPDDPLRILFWGPPGCGKSRLATVLATELSGGQVCNVTRINGQSMTIDVVRQWQQEGQYKSILGGRLVKVVEEVDAASKAAMNELRSWLDGIQNGTALLATTNQPLGEIQEQLSSRCFTYDFNPGSYIDATIKETAFMLASFGLSEADAGSIARNCCGNIRAALIDAETLLDSKELTV